MVYNFMVSGEVMRHLLIDSKDMFQAIEIAKKEMYPDEKIIQITEQPDFTILTA